MKHKKISLIVLLLTSISFLRAQESINASGGDASGAGGKAAYSVGQPVYTAIPGSSNQGVQQPYEFFTVGIDDNQFITLHMSVFPNPAQTVLNIKIENQPLDGLSYQLYDINGRLILTQRISDPLTVIQMQQLPAATYLLSVVDSKKTLKTFSIIKNN